MSLKDILAQYGLELAITAGIIGTLIQISPIKINPWSALSKLIRKFFAGDLADDVKGLREDIKGIKADVGALKAKRDEDRALMSRSRILAFGDELLRDGHPRHTKERFDQVLRDCKLYEDYCDTHPEFENNVAVLTIKLIKEVYEDHMRKQDFLGYGPIEGTPR